MNRCLEELLTVLEASERGQWLPPLRKHIGRDDPPDTFEWCYLWGLVDDRKSLCLTPEGHELLEVLRDGLRLHQAPR